MELSHRPGGPPHQLVRRNEPLLLPLTLLVAFLLATGRWGSYLGIPSQHLFVTEFGLVASAAWVCLRHRRLFVSARLRPLLPLAALATWAVVRFVTGGHFDATAVRDLAPYVYLVAALAAGFAVRSYQRTLVVIEAALVAHLLWLWVALLASGWAAGLPLLGGRVRVFEMRHDFDGAMVAVLVCLAALRAGQRGVNGAVRVVSAIVAMVASYTILQLGTRAGLLALAAAAIVVLLPRLHMLRRVGRARLLASAGLVLVGVALVLPQTYLFQRMTGDPRNSDSGSGTATARQEAWALVLEDATADPTRLIVGSGLGPDFLDRSGAAVWFEGTVDKGVRAPHNYVLNTLGRLGLVGVALLGWVATTVARAAFRRRSHPDVEPDRRRFDEMLVLLVSTLTVASLVGVILESPFGAVPFWWAAGLLIAGSDPADAPLLRRARRQHSVLNKRA